MEDRVNRARFDGIVFLQQRKKMADTGGKGEEIAHSYRNY